MLMRDVRIRVASVALAISVVLGSLAPMNQAQASGVPVVDIVANLKRIQDFIQTQLQWVTENAARAQQYSLLLKNLVRFGNKLQNFNLSPGMQLDPIDPLQGVSQKCGTGFSLNPSGFANMLGLGGESPRVRAQKLCGAIQYMKNIRYNYLVDTLNEILPDISKSLMDLFALLSSLSSDPGDNAAVRLSWQMLQINCRLPAWKWSPSFRHMTPSSSRLRISSA